MDARPPDDPPFVSPVRPFLTDGHGGGYATPHGAPDPADASRVRPYQLTGGRTGPDDADLEIEAQLVATPAGLATLDRHLYEAREIVRLCTTPMAVAEIAVHLRMHLGVARVLVGDLLHSGDLSVRRPETGQHRNAQILERVIRGLEAIR
jgi:hypothetical protein